MSKKSLYLMLLVSVFLPVVYSKNEFFEYFYNKYHKHSSTANTLSSVTESSVTEALSSLDDHSSEEISSTDDDHSSEEISSADDDNLSSPSITFNEGVNISYPSIISHGEKTFYNSNNGFLSSVGIIIGSVILVMVCLGCLVCCCPCCYQGGTERRGFILRNNREERGTEISPQPIVTQYPTSPAGYLIQHRPPDSSETALQQFPPQYHQQPAMPQYHQQQLLQQNHQQAVQPQIPYVPMQPELQYSPNSMHLHNPPEAPPPYAPTAPTRF